MTFFVSSVMLVTSLYAVPIWCNRSVQVHEVVHSMNRKWLLAISIDDTQEMYDIEVKPALEGIQRYVQSLPKESQYLSFSTSERKYYQPWELIPPNGSEVFVSTMETLISGSYSYSGKKRDKYLDRIVEDFGKGDSFKNRTYGLIFVTSCTTNESVSSMITYFIGVYKLFVICAAAKSDKKANRIKLPSINSMFNDIPKEKVHFHEYETYDGFRRFLDEIIPNKNVTVQDCEYTNETSCEFKQPDNQNKNGSCIFIATIKIIRESDGHRQSRNCPNRTAVDCKNGDCECNINDQSSIATGSCTVTCGKGIIPRWYLNPSCKNLASPEDCNFGDCPVESSPAQFTFLSSQVSIQTLHIGLSTELQNGTTPAEQYIKNDKEKSGFVTITIVVPIVALIIIITITTVVIVITRHNAAKKKTVKKHPTKGKGSLIKSSNSKKMSNAQVTGKSKTMSKPPSSVKQQSSKSTAKTSLLEIQPNPKPAKARTVGVDISTSQSQSKLVKMIQNSKA